MENQNQLTEDEIVNPEQFQVGRNPHREENEQQDVTDGTEANGYTSGETAYADGKDTLLDRERDELDVDQEPDDFEDPETDPENDQEHVEQEGVEEPKEEEIDDEESIDESDDDDVDFENPVDDPA